MQERWRSNDGLPCDGSVTLRTYPHVLKSIKFTHTAVWAFFVTCILAVWVFAWRGAFLSAALSIGIVLIEVVVLIVRRQRPWDGLR